MKSSTFTAVAFTSIIAAYALTSLLDTQADQKTRDEKNFQIAREKCGNADWTMVDDGKKLQITCERRKPLRMGKGKP